MRAAENKYLRIVILSACAACAAIGIAGLAASAGSPMPARSLLPILPGIDASHVPVRVAMATAALIAVCGIAGALSALLGNRITDVAALIAFLLASILCIMVLIFTAAVRTGTQSSLESQMTSSLRNYGSKNATVLNAWNEMQTSLKCCGVRTNRAQQSFQITPWFEETNRGSEGSTLINIPRSCCTQEALNSQDLLTKCQTENPPIQTQNPQMQPTGCMETMGQILDQLTITCFVVGALLLLVGLTGSAAFCWQLFLVMRSGKSPSGHLPLTQQQLQLQQQQQQQKQFGSNRGSQYAVSSVGSESFKPPPSGARSLVSEPSANKRSLVRPGPRSLASEPVNQPSLNGSQPSIASQPIKQPEPQPASNSRLSLISEPVRSANQRSLVAQPMKPQPQGASSQRSLLSEANPRANQQRPAIPAANQQRPLLPAANQQRPALPAANQQRPAANQQRAALPSANQGRPAIPAANQQRPAAPAANQQASAASVIQPQPGSSSRQAPRPAAGPKQESHF